MISSDWLQPEFLSLLNRFNFYFSVSFLFSSVGNFFRNFSFLSYLSLTSYSSFFYCLTFWKYNCTFSKSLKLKLLGLPTLTWNYSLFPIKLSQIGQQAENPSLVYALLPLGLSLFMQIIISPYLSLSSPHLWQYKFWYSFNDNNNSSILLL